MDGWMHGWIHGCMDVWVDHGWMDGWLSRWLETRMDGCMVDRGEDIIGWMDAQIHDDRLADARLDGWMD